MFTWVFVEYNCYTKTREKIRPLMVYLSNSRMVLISKILGLVRNIGVSNYTLKHLQELLQYANIKPAVLQV